MNIQCDHVTRFAKSVNINDRTSLRIAAAIEKLTKVLNDPDKNQDCSAEERAELRKTVAGLRILRSRRTDRRLVRA